MQMQMQMQMHALLVEADDPLLHRISCARFEDTLARSG